jgi:hypothetical protein
MTDTQHSDAPWRFEAVPHRAGHGIEGHILPHGATVDDPSVAYVEGVGSVDLALMLAAPDLLAALELYISEHGHEVGCMYFNPSFGCGPRCQQPRAAIEKARGGS